MTDNTQASEDEQIDDILTNAIDYYISGNGVQPEAISRVKSLIRTEKLKLLAEVRERVVGGDEPGITNIMIAAEHAEQRTALTKLEAEL